MIIQLSKCFLLSTTSTQKGVIWKEGTRTSVWTSDVISFVYGGRCSVYKPQLELGSDNSLIQRIKNRGNKAGRPLEALQNFPAPDYTQANWKENEAKWPWRRLAYVNKEQRENVACTKRNEPSEAE